MSGKLYIMRHGTTPWNVLKKLQGRTNISLSEEGREMARRAASEYKDVHFDICYASPLDRALETARLVLEGRDVPIYTDDRLLEMSFGEYEGLEPYDQALDCPIQVFFETPELYTESVGGAESLDQLFERTGSFLKEKAMPQLSEGKDILIVGHGAMNCSIVCQIMNLSRDLFWSKGIENCKLMQLI